MIKRIFDVTAAALALILLSPLLAAVMIALRLTGEGEVFYRQRRIGRYGAEFEILKFATMLKDSGVLPGGDITIRNDPRILPMGKFLRKTKLNELPQLFNILVGDMSLIGPRPLTPRVAELFAPEHWTRIAHLRPGLSGIGSIVFRDEERLLNVAEDRERVYRDVIAPHKAALEAWYADHVGLWTDFKLIFLTLVAVVKPDLDAARLLPDLPSAPLLGAS